MKISLMPMLDGVNPGYEFSYEFQYAKMWASQVSYTWLTVDVPAYIRSENQGEDKYHSFRGRRIGFEQKFFFPETRSERVREYFGLHLNHLETHAVSEPKFKRARFPDNDPIGPTGWRNTARSVFSINFKFGGEIPLFHRFLLDISGGPGIKYRTVTNTYSNPAMREELVEWDILNRYNPMKEWTGTLNFDMKIGYMF